MLSGGSRLHASVLKTNFNTRQASGYSKHDDLSVKFPAWNTTKLEKNTGLELFSGENRDIFTKQQEGKSKISVFFNSHFNDYDILFHTHYIKFYAYKNVMFWYVRVRTIQSRKTSKSREIMSAINSNYHNSLSCVARHQAWTFYFSFLGNLRNI